MCLLQVARCLVGNFFSLDKILNIKSIFKFVADITETNTKTKRQKNYKKTYKQQQNKERTTLRTASLVFEHGLVLLSTSSSDRAHTLHSKEKRKKVNKRRRLLHNIS